MLLQHFYEFLCFYFISIIYEYSVYIIMCGSFQLKISKKRAYVSAFFYANFLTITNALSNIFIAQKLIDETLPIIIITKLTSIIGELLIIRFLARTLKVVWYRSYWLTIILHVALVMPMTYYMKEFTVVDNEKRIIYQGVTWNNLLQYLISISIMLISYVGIWYLVKLILKKIDFNKVSKKYWVVIYTVWSSIILLTLKTYQYTSDNTSKKIVGMENYREVTIALLVIAFCIAISIIHSDQRFLRIENNHLKDQNELQYANYIALQQKDLEIHKLYHDIGNHINTIQILVEQGDAQEAREYTSRLTEQYMDIRRGFYCNNKIINAVLIQKLRVCDENGIRYELEITLPQPLPIQDMDLMCIYSNLLDNAIESCIRNPGTNHYIKIKTTQVGNYLGIKIINSKSSDQTMIAGESGYSTNKKDTNVHGYGLRIIEEIVKYYDGYKELQDNSLEFSAMIMLKLKPAMDEVIVAL